MRDFLGENPKVGQLDIDLRLLPFLNSSHVPPDARICISTIQRMCSILQGRDLDESASQLLTHLHAEKEKGVATKSRTLKKELARRTTDGRYD
jgi:hypothetical protein